MAGEQEVDDEVLKMQRERGDFVDDDEGGEGDGGEVIANDGAPAKPGEKEAPTAGEGEEGVTDGDDKDRRVPYSRFREVNEAVVSEREARIRAETELRLMREGKIAPPTPTPAAPEPVNIGNLRREAKQALMEGDIDKSLELDAQADAELERRAEQRAVERMERDNAIRREEEERTELNQVGARVMAKYPFLDQNHADTNPEAIEDVVALRNGYIAKGMKPGAALEKAADTIAKSLGFEADPAKGNKDDPVKTRQQEGIARSAKAAVQQPAVPLVGRGERGRSTVAEIDIAKLSDDEFRALPEAERARQRGDTV